MRGTRFFFSALVVAASAAVGCGGDVHENDPRPPIPATISVAIAKDAVQVSPAANAEPGERTPNLNQNENAPQNQTGNDDPLVVKIAIANLTEGDTELVLEGPADHVEPIVGSGSASFVTALPSGIYRLSSPASKRTVRMNVGPSRVSSGGDVLIP